MNSPVFSALLQDKELMSEIQGRSKKTMAAKRATLEALEMPVGLSDFKAVCEGRNLDKQDSQAVAEAIVLLDGRPSLLIKDDTFEEPELEYWKARLNPHRSALKATIQSVGRVELRGHSSYDWVGTAWVIGDNLVATNRHVANVFAQKRGAGFVFRQNELGHAIEARVDFKEEYQVGDVKEIPIKKVLYIAPEQEGQPDMAVLELGESDHLPSPIKLAANSRSFGRPIAVIGYPAYDSRNGEDAMRKVFGEIYDVKRFAPGNLLPSSDSIAIQHDCSTLGGNSGSAVVNVENGKVIGLHFGGRFRERNFAVKVEVIRSVMDRLPASRTTVLPLAGAEAPTIASLAGREGYRADFLGAGRRVRLPILTADQEEDAVSVPGRNDFVLPYMHFSVVMCQSRRLCYFTAVNIDGENSINLRRTGDWSLDPRIPAESQIGNELYVGNNLDRGHMVRRLDPVWGSQAIARQANNDTFMYTNACPQHARLNQGIWNDLEDYILGNADEKHLKVSVFTGPVFSADDPIYRGVKIPQEFWKVVVMVKANDELSATAYLQTQRQYMDDLEAPDFVFGQFRTYQVPISRIETLTRYSFGTLSSHDPMAGSEGVSNLKLLAAMEDVVL